MEIRPMNKEDISSVVLLADNVFGDGYVPEERLQELIDKDNSFCNVIDNDGQVIGFCTFDILEFDQWLKDVKIDKLDEKYWFCFNDNNHKVGYIKQLVVDPKHQRQGNGRKLLTHCMKELKENVREVVMTVWMHGTEMNLRSLIEHLNFELFHFAENYWYEDSLERKFNCPKCGFPCYCDCAFYKLNLFGETC